MTAFPESGRASQGLSLVLLLVLGLNWGLGFSLGKLGVTGGLHPLSYSFWACSGGGLVLLVICAARRQLPPLTWTHARYYVLAGASNIAAPNFISLTSAQHIPVGIIVLLVSLSPLITYGVAQIAGLERFNPRRAIGIVFGLGGAALILIPKTSLPSPEVYGWVLFALLTPLCYGISNVYLAWARPPDVPSLALGGAMQLGAGAALLPLALGLGKMHLLLPPLTVAETANLAHIGVASLGSLIFFELMRMRGPVFASQVGYIVCLSGVFWGKLFFAEEHSIWVWLAMGVIFAGLTLVTWPVRAAIQNFQKELR